MTAPTRPPFRPANRPSKLSEAIGYIVRFAWLAVVFFGVYYLYNMAAGGPKAPAEARNANATQAQLSTADAARPPAPEPAPPEANVNAPQPPQVAARDIEQATAGSVERQQLAAGKFKQRQAVALFEETKAAFDEWEKELSAWRSEGPSLLTSADGRRIAADQTLIKQFRTVLAQQRPTEGQLSAAKAGASELIAPVREALANPADASVPGTELVTSLHELQDQARKARDELHTATEQMRAILAHAGPEKAQSTLQEAMAAQVREEAEARTDAITAEVKKAEEIGNKKIAEEKAKAALAEKQQQAERIRADAERQARAAKAAEEQQAQAAKMALLRQKAHSPEVHRYLAPFLASGFSQPNHTGGNSVIFNRTADEGPMSLTRIRNVGGLDKTQDGIKALNWIASSDYNDRTVKWNFGMFLHQLTPDTMRFIKRSQELLIELGDALVEEKMLAP